MCIEKRTKTMPEKLLTLAMVCARVSLSPSYVRKLIQQGKFPRPSHVFGSRAVRWSESSINDWIEKHCSET